MKRHVWALLFLVALLTACAPARQSFKELAVPPQRSLHTGFSLLPLNENGWVISEHQPQFLILGKYGSDPDESYILRAFTVVLPEFTSRDEFVGFAKTAIGGDLTRYNVLMQEAKTVAVKGESCVNVQSMVEDRAARKRSNRPDPMLIEAYSLVCPHPQKKIAVVVAYSHRYYSGQADPESAQKAERIFETIEFREF